jgi:hypothetical protein
MNTHAELSALLWTMAFLVKGVQACTTDFLVIIFSLDLISLRRILGKHKLNLALN